MLLAGRLVWALGGRLLLWFVVGYVLGVVSRLRLGSVNLRGFLPWLLLRSGESSGGGV